MATAIDAAAQSGQRCPRSGSDVQMLTQAPYSYTLLQQDLYHPRHQSKKSLRRALKNLIRNQTRSSRQAYPTHKAPAPGKPSPPRPLIMQMKDSDDYLTARFPNPRTGAVSPSIPSASPSPENAVAQAATALPPCDPDSPCPSIASSTANQSRKISSGQRWRADAKGWLSENAVGSVASPRSTEVEAGAEMVKSGGGRDGESHGDKFVMHMPSAREPQPFRYPGRSGEEIERLEKKQQHRASTKPSLEGRRAANGPAGKVLLVRETQAALGSSPEDMPEATPSNFAPFSSPRTPAPPRPVKEPTTLRTVKHPAPYRDISPHAAFQAIPRRPVGSSPLIDVSTPGPLSETPQRPGSGPELRALPHMRILRPELAAVPVKLRHVSERPVRRDCSLGCVKEMGTDKCRLRNGSVVTVDRRPLFEISPMKGPAEAKVAKKQKTSLTSYEAVELLSLGVGQLLWFWNRFRMPDLKALAPLVTPEATAQQKLEATKAVLWMSAQFVGALCVLLGLWRVTAAVVQIVSVLFWPIMVPLAIVRWLVVGK